MAIYNYLFNYVKICMYLPGFISYHNRTLEREREKSDGEKKWVRERERESESMKKGSIAQPKTAKKNANKQKQEVRNSCGATAVLHHQTNLTHYNPYMSPYITAAVRMCGIFC